MHEHDRHSVGVCALDGAKPFIVQRDLSACLDPGVSHVHALDPYSRQLRRVRQQDGSQRREKLTRCVTRSTRTVRDHIECVETESTSKNVQQTFDPRFGSGNPHDGLQAELHRVRITPQQGIGRI